ncbi:GNAT family N-acetyltransferase [Streptomyces platensis]|uniref:Acetyltransferase (GNAT) family protein n=1 Tax=Streptomyces platensis TaxID=58346 RepID=A0AAE6TLC1_STRPT|nr:GNAT family N-acetyltransferase [Streptomyces platensis]OSY45888.1 Acetyltransferase (GNAT) family protein [Streptomyces platensis]QEV51422.1 GNAT family N-acetyltransferase [Streptomyces platensis]
MSGSESVRGLQERAARALPADYVEEVAGWRLRHSPSCSWWVGTVLPHGVAGPDELGRRIRGVEEFYAGRHAVARFQISPGVCPDGLDTALAERGYRRESVMSLRVAPTAGVPAPAAPGALRVRLAYRPTSAWFDVWHAVHGHGGDPRPEWDLLARVAKPSAYACAMAGDEVVAVGRAVADTGWAGVFGMATLPAARGKGAARTVLSALASWAGDQAADRMYLQVARGHVPALRLYEQAGFRELCSYHYRTAA